MKILVMGVQKRELILFSNSASALLNFAPEAILSMSSAFVISPSSYIISFKTCPDPESSSGDSGTVNSIRKKSLRKAKFLYCQ